MESFILSGIHFSNTHSHLEGKMYMLLLNKIIFLLLTRNSHSVGVMFIFVFYTKCSFKGYIITTHLKKQYFFEFTTPHKRKNLRMPSSAQIFQEKS